MMRLRYTSVTTALGGVLASTSVTVRLKRGWAGSAVLWSTVILTLFPQFPGLAAVAVRMPVPPGLSSIWIEAGAGGAPPTPPTPAPPPPLAKNWRVLYAGPPFGPKGAEPRSPPGEHTPRI